MGDRHFMQRRGPNTSLYVRPIDETMRPDEVKAHFAQHGHIRDVHIPIDFNTRKPRGFAYIEFQNLNEAQEACDRINKTEFHGKLLYVDFAAGDRKTPGQMKTQKEAIALKLKIDQLRELQEETRRKAREAEMIREGIPLNREEERGYKDRRFIRDDRGGGSRRDDRGGRDDRRGGGRYDDRGGGHRDHRSDHRGGGGGDRRDSYGGGRDHHGGGRNRSRSPRRDYRRDERHDGGGRSDSRGGSSHGGSSRGGERYDNDRRRDDGGRRDHHHDDRRGSYKEDYKQERHDDRGGDRRIHDERRGGHDDRRHDNRGHDNRGHDNQGGYDDRRGGSRSHHEHDDRGYKQERDDRR